MPNQNGIPQPAGNRLPLWGVPVLVLLIASAGASAPIATPHQNGARPPAGAVARPVTSTSPAGLSSGGAHKDLDREIAEIKRELTVRDLALIAAQTALKNLQQRAQSDPQRVLRGGAGDATAQKWISDIAGEVDGWETDLTALKSATDTWQARRVRYAFAAARDDKVAPVAHECVQRVDELLKLFDELSVTLHRCVAEAQSLANAIEQAVEQRSQQSLSLRSESRLNPTTIRAAVTELRSARRPVAAGLGEWWGAQRDSLFLYLVLAIAVALSIPVAGMAVLCGLRKETRGRTRALFNALLESRFHTLVRPTLTAVGLVCGARIAISNSAAASAVTLALLIWCGAWSLLHGLHAWSAAGTAQSDSDAMTAAHRRTIARRASVLLVWIAIWAPAFCGLVLFKHADTAAGLVVQNACGLTTIALLVWVCYGRFGWLHLPVREDDVIHRRLAVLLHILTPLFIGGLLAVVGLRAAGYYNLSLYLGRNLPLSALVLAVAVMVFRRWLPWMTARVSSVWGKHGMGSVPRRTIRRTFATLMSTGLGLLTVALLLYTWSISHVGDMLGEAALAAALGCLAGAAAASLVVPWTIRPLEKFGGGWGDEVTRLLTFPVAAAGVFFGAHRALVTVFPGDGYVERYYHGALAALAVYAMLSITSELTRRYADIAHTEGRPEVVPAVMLGRKLGNIAIFAIGITLVVNQLGYKITPILAGMGVAGVGVAMALQDTLKNLFAGFYVMLDRALKPGDYVTLDSGEEGFIQEIGWRNTKVRPWSNNLVVIPNSKLSEAVVTNQYLPAQEQSITVLCGVSYESDLDYVEQVCIEVARATMARVPGAAPDWKPIVRYTEFGDSNINFRVVLRVKEAAAQYVLIHEFIKDLFRRFKQEGIEINYPTSNVYLRGVPQPSAEAATSKPAEETTGPRRIGSASRRRASHDRVDRWLQTR